MTKRFAYDETSVPVSRSQQEIRELVGKHNGKGVAFVSEPPMEGFQAKVDIEGTAYTIRIHAELRSSVRNPEQELRRIWRVLFFHLKGIFVAADSGVLGLRELILPYIVTNDGKTIAEHILPKLEAALGDPSRMLPAPRRQ